MDAGSTLTIIRGAINTRTGVWVEASRHDIAPCGVDPTGTSELTANQDTVTADVTVYGPYGADALAPDRAIIDGDESELFDVVGEVANWRSPFSGDTPGCVIRLVHHKG